MADALAVIDAMKRNLAELTVQNIALQLDLQEAQKRLAPEQQPQEPVLHEVGEISGRSPEEKS